MYSTFLAIIGVYLIAVLAVVIVIYVLYGISHMKALKALGYDKPWMAWIPFANYWALAEVVLNGQESITLFDSLNIPAMLFKLWWVIAFCVSYIPGLGAILNVALRVICLGTCYTKIYARLDRTDEKDTQVLGYVSGFISIVASCKFLAGKYNN